MQVPSMRHPFTRLAMQVAVLCRDAGVLRSSERRTARSPRGDGSWVLVRFTLPYQPAAHPPRAWYGHPALV